MRKIIKGTRYDTSTATKIGEAYGGSEFVNDFRYWREALYRTPRSRRYFIHGEGGAMTRYARRIGPAEWVGGERIIPLAPEDAYRWACKNLDPKIVEGEFPGITRRLDDHRGRA